jgi:pantetheine-phosphate adenylyltransferase
MKVLYPGTFDPITLGHIDLVARASSLFKSVLVAIIKNPAKKTLFSFEERFNLARDTLSCFKNVKVSGFDGLVVDYAKKKKIAILIRGLRMVSDFEYEFQMALTNRKLEEKIETMFLMPHPDYSYISSRLIKEAFFLGADVSPFISPVVLKALKRKKNEDKNS